VIAAFTVIGGAGFVGSELVRHLEALGHTCSVPARGEPLTGRDLGHVVYCGGLTGDWRSRPYETLDAHVETPAELVRAGSFDSFLYLSSTRVYDRHPGALAREDDELTLRPDVEDDFYALSKAAGEAVVLAAGGRVARLSNVYGPRMERHAFLSILLRDAVERGRVTLESSLDSARDFVGLSDVAALLTRIALEGRERIYNVAGGVPVTNAALTDALAQITGCEVAVRPGAPRVVRPAVDISRAREEFGFAPARLLDDLPALLMRQRELAAGRP
jgi:nucleoside-diphosphate-sugar epimerase